jgi:hypothetical protein
MAVEIKSGASSDLLIIDPTSNAARVTLYDAGGNPLNRKLTASAVASVVVRQSAATGAGVVVWGVYNPSATVGLYITKIDLRCFFDGTAAATLMKYEVVRGTSVTTFSGGATVTPALRATSQSSVSTVRILDTGLTTTGLTNTQILGNLIMGRVTQTATNFQYATLLLDFTGFTNAPLKLIQNEMLVIRQTVTSVVGDNIVGSVEWNESL